MFNMAAFKVICALLASHFKLSATQCSIDAITREKMSYVSYNQTVDNLMYLIICPIHDVALAINKLNMYISNSKNVQCEVVKWIFRYSNKYKDYGLLFDGLLKNVKFLLCYVDTEFK